jgi:hypothetical protein
MVILTQTHSTEQTESQPEKKRKKNLFVLTVNLWRILQSQIDFEKLEEVLWSKESSFWKWCI